MTWLRRQRVRHYVGNSIWILPALGMIAALGAVRLLNAIDAAMGWRAGFHPEAARTVLGALSSSMFTLIIFVSSALLVAVQLASAQLTPRIIAIVFRDPVTKFSLTLFAFTCTFSIAALIRITSFVPLLTAHVTVYGSLVSLAVFFYLIDHLGKALRPSGALRGVARLGRAVIKSVYPRLLADLPDKTGLVAAPVFEGMPTAIIPSPKAGVVLAFDQAGLLSL